MMTTQFTFNMNMNDGYIVGLSPLGVFQLEKSRYVGPKDLIQQKIADQLSKMRDVDEYPLLKKLLSNI